MRWTTCIAIAVGVTGALGCGPSPEAVAANLKPMVQAQVAKQLDALDAAYCGLAWGCGDPQCGTQRDFYQPGVARIVLWKEDRHHFSGLVYAERGAWWAQHGGDHTDTSGTVIHVKVYGDNYEWDLQPMPAVADYAQMWTYEVRDLADARARGTLPATCH